MQSITTSLALNSPGLLHGVEPLTDSDTEAVDNSKSPLYILPLEILGLIFEIAQQILQSTDEVEARRLPLIISQVTRRWRDVALSSPILWVSIDISPAHWALDALKLRLERSQPLPVDLGLVKPNHDFTSDYANNLLEIITPHIPRCRSIYIDSRSRGENLTKLFVSLSGLAAPRLERLLLSWSQPVLDSEVWDIPMFPSGAPMLTDARLRGVAPLFNVPLSSLTTLHLSHDFHDMSYPHFRQMMTSCSSLTTLAFYDDLVMWPYSTVSLEVTNIDTLRSLQIYGGMMNIAELMTCVSAPNLEELIITPFEPNDLEAFPAPQSPSLSKFPHLKSLVLGSSRPDGTNIVLASNYFPTIDQLVLASPQQSVLKAVFVDPGLGVVWPALQTLVLCNIDHGGEAAVADMITHRRAAGYPLRKLYLGGDTIRRFTLLPWLESQVEVEELDVRSRLYRLTSLDPHEQRDRFDP